jgi:glycogen(starch) synthase
VINGRICHVYGKPHEVPNHFSKGGILMSPEGVQFVQVPWDNAVEPSVRLVRSWQPDVVHLHTHWAWPVARAIQEQTGTCLIYTVHSVDRAEYELGEEGPNLLDRCGDQEAALAAANRVIALTRHERELLTRYYPWARRGVRIVGNGIDEIATESLRKVRRTDESLLILYSGRLVERKGIAELFAAIPQVLAKYPATRFVIAGGPAHWGAADVERQWLNSTISPYRSQIQFTGWLPPTQVSRWYREADVLVVPSRYEPFGMVVLEGMLHGLPIVAASAGGPKEILQDGRTGLLFPPKDVGAFVQALLRLIEDPALRKRLGRAAARNVRRRWLWARTVEQMRSVYNSALNEQARRRTLVRAADPVAATRLFSSNGSNSRIREERNHA